jgi:ABC-type Fe3+ transport system permease subunit
MTPRNKPILPKLIAAMVVVTVAALIVLPTIGVIIRVVDAWNAQDVRSVGWHDLAIAPRLLASTVAWAMGVAVAAVVLAWLPAVALARRGAFARGGNAVLAVMVMVPMLLPSYLIYHALGLSRAPQTLLGDWLEKLSHGAFPDAPVLAGRVLAFAGLALWMWPIAAVVMAWALAGVSPTVIESLRVDGASRVRRHVEMMRVVRGSMLWSAALVVLVMLGSSVPLHLAQVPTIAIQAWLSVNIDPTNVKVWLSSWLVLLVAVVMSVVFARRLSRVNAIMDETGNAARKIGGVDWTVVVLGCLACSATLLPLVLYAIALRSWKSLGVFVRVSGDAVVRSGLIAVGVAAALAALTVVVWYVASQRSASSRRYVGFAAFFAIVGLLTPGTLVGQAWALAVNEPMVPYWFVDTPVPSMLAHVTRFMGLAVLAGIFFARSESENVRAQRELDAGASVWAWAVTSVRGKGGALLGLMLAFACLSLHEIDASIVLQQPGTQSLAQTLLAQLHFARQEEMAAGAIVVVGSGLVVAMVAAALLVVRGVRER